MTMAGNDNEIHVRCEEACQTAQTFSKLYYDKMDKMRQNIGIYYLDTAVLSWNGNKIEGNLDPLGQPKVTTGRDNCFRTCCPYVRLSPLFESRTTKQQKTMA